LAGYEKNNDFYYCYMPRCRVTFEDAVELIFRCPTCGKALQHYDNSAMDNALADKIEQLEGGKG
jgi:transcription initiation factor TFIIE subunit alpha